MKKSIKMSLLIFICLLFAMLVFAQSVPRQSHSASEIEAGVLQGDYSITGKLGIGTNNLRTPLTVVVPGAIYPGASNSRATMSLARNSNNYLLMETPGETTAGFGLAGTKFIIATDREDIEFKTGISFSENWNSTGISRMVIDSSGNVGIGAINPQQKLDVVGRIHAAGDICTSAGGGKCLSTAGGSSGTNGWNISGNNMFSTILGNIGIGTTSPSQKLHITSGNIYLDGGQNIIFGGTRVLSRASASEESYLRGDGIKFQNPSASTTFMTIKSSGNVGIGETNPTSPLQVRGGNAALSLQAPGTTSNQLAALQFIRDDGTLDANLWNAAGGTDPFRIKSRNNMQFHTNSVAYDGSVPQMIITTTGNVGIGTTNPAQKLHIKSVLILEPTDMPGSCSSALKGSIYYDDSLNEPCYCDGALWKQFDGGGNC